MVKIENIFYKAEAKIAPRLADLNKESIKPEDIDEIADTLVRIIKASRPEDIKTGEFIGEEIARAVSRETYKPGRTSVPSFDLFAEMNRITYAILDKVKTRIYQDPEIDESKVMFIEEILSASERIAKIQDTNKVYKRYIDYRCVADNENREQALAQLKEILDAEAKKPEADRHPYYKNVRYPAVARDLENKSEIQRMLKFGTLYDLITESEKKESALSVDAVLDIKQDDLKEILSRIIDALKGCAFLHQHGLALTDNRPRNIGIDEDGVGFIFDFDGLCLDDTTIQSRVISAEDQSKKFRTINEKHMLFQFGLMLDALFTQYNLWFQNPVIKAELLNLTQELFINNDNFGDGNLRIESVIGRLKTILESL
ncbi:MAG: hypothetical protein V1898_03355 [Patescibacteria group bacterium]